MNSLFPLMEKQEEEDANLQLFIFSSKSHVASSSSSKLAFATCFSGTTQHDHQRVNLHHHDLLLQQSHHQLQHDHQRVNLHHHDLLLQQSHHQLQHDHHQAEKSIGGSREESNEVITFPSSTREALERSRSNNIDHQDHQQQLDDDDHEINKLQDQNGSGAKQWMSSKTRLMQKMMINKDKKVGHVIANSATRGGKWEIRAGRYSSTTYNNSNGHNNNNNNNNGVRVCSDCNTTTTPLWRSGPQGPKTLCNACGIRQRKARRAMAEATNGGGGGSVVVASEMPSKKSRLGCQGDGGNIIVGEVKNKCNKNMTDNSWESRSEGTNDGVSFDRHNFTLRWSKSGSAFGRVFPRDEEEAAILLMELSCGLVHS